MSEAPWSEVEHYRLGPDLPLFCARRQEFSVWAAGHASVTAPAHFEFADLICNQLKGVLTPEWITEQRNRDECDRHVLVTWWDAMIDEWNRGKAVAASSAANLQLTPSGKTRSLLSLARDVFCLLAVDSFGDGLRSKLCEPNRFQATRYEIAVAAVFARCGYEIQWISDRKTSKKHPEFVAVPWAVGKDSGVLDYRRQVCVEAKSRHRDGVLGHVSGNRGADRDWVKDRVIAACSQADKFTDYSEMPLIVFMDMNDEIAGTPTPEDIRWVRDGAFAHFESLGEGHQDEVFGYSTLCFTNFGYHYFGEQDSGSGCEYLIHLAPKSTHPLIEPRLFAMLTEAIGSYGKAPSKRA